MSPMLGASELRRALRVSLDALRTRRAAIDAANVYPVPDGDTGTNLVLTFEAIARAMDGLPDDEATLARAVKTSSLMGARGNSGVIMAQILRGLSEAVDDGPAGPERIAAGLQRAVVLAYEAVLDPAEGTILTVARAAADAAAGSHADAVAQFDAVARAAQDALARTPEQLPILAQAGVVDAGGMGLVAVLDSFAATLAGREPDDALPSSVPGVHPSTLCEGNDGGFAFEVMYLLQAPADVIAVLREQLGAIGGSVVVVGGDGLWRVHVHTDEQDAPVRLGRAVGSVSGVEVVSLIEQIANAATGDVAATDVTVRAPATEPAAGPVAGQRGIPVADAPARSALVVVASGDGIRSMFRELGAVVVDGGPTMNPSVAELLAAIDAVAVDDVLVLPNNDNVFAAAAAAKGEASKQVALIRTNDMAEGLAAALEFDPARDTEQNVLHMDHAVGRVRTGQVAIANRSAVVPEGAISAGNALGFAEGSLVVPHGDPNDPVVVVAAVVQALVQPGDAVVTVLCGDGVPPDERARTEASLREILPALDIEFHDGGQPVHRYLISVE